MTFTTMTIGDLCVSPLNVRTNKHDAEAVDTMAQSLLARGQLHPLIVHPMPRKGKEKQIYGAVAGGRRYRAFKMLIDRGDLPADHPIDVSVRDIETEGELIELSLAENLPRADLRHYEVFAAVHRAADGGRSLTEIANTTGQDVEMVRRWARLGNLHPTVFAALEHGRLSVSQAQAFAATEDQALQLWAFEQVCDIPGGDWQRSDKVIRKLLKVGDDQLRSHLLFVGEHAYREAGGRYELDLFADFAGERGRVVDEGLLMQLVERKLDAKRKLLRTQAGRDLRFEGERPRDRWQAVDHDLLIDAPYAELDTADAERLTFLENEMDELANRASKVLEEPESDERRAAIAAIDVEFVPLETEAAAIEARRKLILPDGDIFGTLSIEGGELQVEFWWKDRKAKASAEKAMRAGAGAGEGATGAAPAPVSARYVLRPEAVAGGSAIDSRYHFQDRQKADAAIRQSHGLPAAGVDALRSIRREVLRVGLFDEARHGGDLGLDYLVWTLARSELVGGVGHQFGARTLASSCDNAQPVAGAFLAETAAHDAWTGALAWLGSHPCMVEKDLALAFRHFRGETRTFKRSTAAIVAGLMLERSAEADGYRVPLHDLLAQGCGFDDIREIRALVEPSEQLVGIMPVAQRLTQVESRVDAATFRAFGKAKARDLVAPVARALRDGAPWVHPLLRFAGPAPASEKSTGNPVQADAAA